jgi:hypothetical protein
VLYERLGDTTARNAAGGTEPTRTDNDQTGVERASGIRDAADDVTMRGVR